MIWWSVRGVRRHLYVDGAVLWDLQPQLRLLVQDPVLPWPLLTCCWLQGVCKREEGGVSNAQCAWHTVHTSLSASITKTANSALCVWAWLECSKCAYVLKSSLVMESVWHALFLFLWVLTACKGMQHVKMYVLRD